jgi:hypothetical protein
VPSSSSIDLGVTPPFIRTEPVYRNGKIYIAGDECAAGGGYDDGCQHDTRVIVVPVFRAQPSGILASSDASLGYRNITLGGPGQSPEFIRNRVRGRSFEVPAVEVDKDDDVVVMIDRARDVPIGGEAAELPGVTYSVFYAPDFQRRDGVLQAGTCSTPLKCFGMFGPAFSHMDLGGIAVDPVDDETVWMSNGYGDADLPGYRMVIGKVLPRPKP